MEPVALRGPQGPMFDPMGAAQKGMQLGQMGLEAQRLREALLTQQLEQERMRQTIQTEAIAQQKSRLEYQQAARKEDARKGLARLRTQFITKDSTGKEYLDHQGLYAEAVKQGYEPDVLEDLQQKALSTEASKVKTASEKTAAFDTFFTNLTRANANQTDPNKVAQNFQNGITQFANTFGVPKEEVEAYARTKMNWQPDETGRPPDILANIRGYLQGIDISEKEQREAEARGEGRSAFDPNSQQSKQAREFLISRGLTPPANINFNDMKNHPIYGPMIRIWEQERTSQIVPGTERLRVGIEAADIQAARGKFIEALKYENDMTRNLVGKPGAVAADLWQKVALEPKYSKVQNAFAEAMKARGIENANIKDYDYKNVFDTIRSVSTELGVRAGARERAGASQAPAATAGTATQTRPPEEERRVQSDVLRQEYEAKVERLKQPFFNSKTGKPDADARRRAEADLDDIARELKKLGVNVPGSSDVLRGKTAPKMVTFVMKGNPNRVVGRAEEGSAAYKKAIANPDLEVAK